VLLSNSYSLMEATQKNTIVTPASFLIPTFLEGSRKVAKEILAKFNARDGRTIARGRNHASN